MTRQTIKGLGQLLVAGTMIVASVAGSGCGARSSDRDVALSDQYIKVMDEALARGDANAARMARDAAYLAALGSLRWEAMAAVGDASVRFAASTGVGPALQPAVRRSYLVALYRARSQGSLEGVLRVSGAFAELGDREVAREGLAMAASMAAARRGAHDAERVKSLVDRLENENPVSVTEGPAEEVRASAAAAATWTR